MSDQSVSALSEAERGHIEALVRACHGDPFAYLGPHSQGEEYILRAFMPRAISVEVLDALTGKSLGVMSQDLAPGLFTLTMPA